MDSNSNDIIFPLSKATIDKQDIDALIDWLRDYIKV